MALATDVLARPPVPPRDPSLFTSDRLFGEPGIYPSGSPMAPAEGPAPNPSHARAKLAEVLAKRSVNQIALLVRFDDPKLIDAVPDPVARAALVALSGTVADPLVAAFPSRATASELRLGAPASPGRIVGPGPEGGPIRVVNERYRAEHPALLAPSLAHDLLWTPETSGHAAEAVLHSLAAIVHLQAIARNPRLAHLGTELARRQNSLAISLLNSRRPGSPTISLMAPNGPGTIPGGAPTMQTRDFWSIPFAHPRPTATPGLFADVLDRVVDPAVDRPSPLRFDEALGRWLSASPSIRWLPRIDQLRANIILGLIDPTTIAVRLRQSDELADAIAVWG